MSFEVGSQLLNNENAEVISLKRHCINLLLKLVTSLPGVIKQHVQTILSVVLRVERYVSAMQKANLVQILAALSNSTDSLEEQQAFLTQALQHVLVFFESAEFKM